MSLSNVTILKNNTFQGPSTVQKPLDVPKYSRWLETDNNIEYIFNGASWISFGAGSGVAEAQLGAYPHIIYQAGSLTKSKNNISGLVEASNTDPDPVWQTAMSAGGGVYVMPGNYFMSNALTGLEFPYAPNHTNLVMDINASPIVPNGYSGYLFRFRNAPTGGAASYMNSIRGGLLQEAGATPQRNWIAIEMAATGSVASGCYSNVLESMQINYPKIAFHIVLESGATLGFNNTNVFSNNLIFGAKEAYFDFDMGSVTHVPSQNGFYRNRFYNNTLEATNGTDAVTGFRNIRHKDNIFIGNYPADFSGSQITATIHADAIGTEIWGGTMRSLNFVDNSVSQSTVGYDDVNGLSVKRITPGNAGTNLDVIPTGATNTWSWWNSTQTERFYMQKTATQYLFDFTRQLAGGALRPAVFRMYDVPGNAPIESFRIDTDSITKFAKPIDLTTQTTPANPASGASRIYVKTIDANNDGVFALIKKNGAFVEVQIL
jgi:hypothetical protein